MENKEKVILALTLTKEEIQEIAIETIGRELILEELKQAKNSIEAIFTPFLRCLDEIVAEIIKEITIKHSKERRDSNVCGEND